MSSPVARPGSGDRRGGRSHRGPGDPAPLTGTPCGAALGTANPDPPTSRHSPPRIIATAKTTFVSQPRRWAPAMTVRIQMKLGVVADTQRLPDSPDTVLVVEPSVGSTARTKGNLYLLVTATGGRRLRDATRMVAERVRDEYYYDESAGSSVCLQKAIRSANKR